jgi:hypothetical protein
MDERSQEVAKLVGEEKLAGRAIIASLRYAVALRKKNSSVQ